MQISENQNPVTLTKKCRWFDKEIQILKCSQQGKGSHFETKQTTFIVINISPMSIYLQ
jgi:hypothetical protein